MNGQTAKEIQGASLLRHLVWALRESNVALNALASEVLVMLGQPVIPILVGEVMGPWHTTDHRLRLLRVIARIGPGDNDLRFRSLAQLIETDPDARIQVAVAAMMFYASGDSSGARQPSPRRAVEQCVGEDR